MKQHSILSALLSIFCALFILMRFWAILLLALPLLLVIVPVVLAVRKHKAAMVPTEQATPHDPPKTQPKETPEHIRLFRQVQAEVSQQVQASWPGSVWVWEKPNQVMTELQQGLTSCILIRNSGYARAQVFQQNGTIKVRVEHVQPTQEEDHTEPVPVDYSLLAAEWMDENILLLNSMLNEHNTATLTRDELPICDAWADIIQALKENQLNAEVLPDSAGILVSLKGV